MDGEVKKDYSRTALIFSILGCFIPFLGLIFAIVGIVLGFKSLNSQNRGMAIIAIVIGFIAIFITLIVLPIIALVGFQTWFYTYQTSINEDIQKSPLEISGVTVERVELDVNNSVIVYINNKGNTEFIGNLVVDDCYGDIRLQENQMNIINIENCSLNKGDEVKVNFLSGSGMFLEYELVR